MISPPIQEFDAVVIGAGPAGERGAAQAAYFGKSVAIIEKAVNPGGACSNTGTLPSKTFRETALHLSGLATRGLTSIHYDINSTVTAKELLNKNTMVISSDHERIHRNLGKHGIEYIRGEARFADKNTVEVFDHEGNVKQILKAKVFLIATGSSPHRPSEVPFDEKCVWDSDSVLDLETIPKRLTVVGSGVIGSEYAAIFAALGVHVELIDFRDQYLPFLDREISCVLVKEMERVGVHFKLGRKVMTYEKKDCIVKVTLDDGQVIESDALLYAVGRNGSTRNIGLEKIGLTPDKRGQLKVNVNYQTDLPHIYAAGDVIGFPALASTSMDQGRLAMSHAFNMVYSKSLPEHLPLGIYTIPEVSAVGETEESAREKKIDYEIGIARLSDNARAEIMGDLGGILKIVFDAKSRQVLGVHIVCERASEIITPGLVAVRLGANINFFVETVFNFPTLCEAYKYAAYDGLGRLALRNLPIDSI